MVRSSSLILGMVALPLWVGGCDSDFTILPDAGAVGVPNPPNLATPVKEDVIVQITTPEVDILWVIDNSGSMSEEQKKLKDNFGEFIKFFVDSGLDWHIGIVSTDTDADRGRLQGAGGTRFMTPDTPNPIDTFRQMATLGTNGSSDERGRRAAHMALTDPNLSGYNAGFYRDNASLHLIVISDELDSSGNDPTSNEFINFLNALKPDPEMVTFSSIVGPEAGCATSDSGRDYLRITEAVGGISESICRDDWSQVLEQLGLQAAGLKREYFLSEVPVPGTIEVWVEQDGFVYDGVDVALLEDGSDISDHCPTQACFSFQYDAYRNSILMLDFVPSPLAKVHARYELLSGWQPSAGSETL
ncbi:MAG TPA: hypothetical protein PKA64_08135 [Myxococcota bacterium]|nr:hypothetical protein [Myxococcota bacterium]